MNRHRFRRHSITIPKSGGITRWLDVRFDLSGNVMCLQGPLLKTQSGLLLHQINGNFDLKTDCQSFETELTNSGSLMINILEVQQMMNTDIVFYMIR
jgi:hypothetical protein